MSNDKFILRNGSPLFSPQDHGSGFQSGSGEVTRRRFLKRTGGATAAASIAAWSLTKSTAYADPYSGSEEYEYALKCVTAPEGALYKIKPRDIDPNGPGDETNTTVTLRALAVGPSEGAVAQSFTVTLTSWTTYENESLLNPGSQTSNLAVSSCTITLVSPDSSVVTVTPNPQLVKNGDNGDVSSLALVTPAFSAQAVGAYKDAGGAVFKYKFGAGHEIGYEASPNVFKVGPITFDWSIVLVKRVKDSGAAWLPVDPQPDWSNHKVPKIPNPEA